MKEEPKSFIDTLKVGKKITTIKFKGGTIMKIVNATGDVTMEGKKMIVKK